MRPGARSGERGGRFSFKCLATVDGYCSYRRFKSFIEEGGRMGIYRLAGLAWPEGVRLHEFSWFLVPEEGEPYFWSYSISKK